MSRFNNQYFVRLANKRMEWVNLDKTLTHDIIAPNGPDVPRWQWDGYVNGRGERVSVLS